VGAAVAVEDKLNWSTHWTLVKYDEDIDALVEDSMPFWAKGPMRNMPRAKARAAEIREQFQNELEPAEVIEWDGNMLVNCGINELLQLLIGAAAVAYANATSSLGVGDSNAAAAAGQTDMQAALNKVYVASAAAYPTVAGQTVTFQSSFGAAVGTWAWEECGAFNAAAPVPPGDIMLNRVVQSLGTKAAAATWVLSLAITIS